VEDRETRLGPFPDEETASRAYRMAEMIYHKDALNIMGQDGPADDASDGDGRLGGA
jgi:hypothetical protein